MRYRISEWSKHYENNRTRGLKKLDWVPIPNRMDGEGYLELVEDHPNGAAHFGAWIAIVEIASRQEMELRGELPQGDAGLSHSLAKRSRIPKAIFEEVIPRLLKLQWIEEFTDKPQCDAEIRQHGAEIPQHDAPRVRVRREGKEGNGREGNETQSVCDSLPRFEEFWAVWSTVRGTAYRPQAVHAWGSVVTSDRLAAEAVLCAASYVALHDNPVKGFNPQTFLFEMAKDYFRARWPPRANGPPETKPARGTLLTEILAEKRKQRET